MPYACKFCKGRYCAAHRLPENHGCTGLGAYRERVRSEGRPFASEPGTPLQPKVSGTARASAALDAMWSRLDGKMTYVIMGICVGVYLLEYVVLAGWGWLFDDLFIIQFSDFLLQPWTIVTSVFSHAPDRLNHILFNMLALLFFGGTVEKLIGTRRFTYLFLSAGAIAGVAQVVFMHVLARATDGAWGDLDSAALGASGALQGIMGTLVVLAPTLTVLVFFIVPAPLWALTILYVLLDVVGVITPNSGVANLAHLAGLAVGLAYGWHLRKKGLRVVMRPQPPSMGRQL